MKIEIGAVCECQFCHLTGRSYLEQTIPEDACTIMLCARCAVGIALVMFDLTKPPLDAKIAYELLLTHILKVKDLDDGPQLATILFS